MIVPEINLNSEDLDQHIAAVNRAMRTYLRRHIFHEVHDYIYTRLSLIHIFLTQFLLIFIRTLLYHISFLISIVAAAAFTKKERKA